MSMESSTPPAPTAATEAANAGPGPGWSTEEQLREHLLAEVAPDAAASADAGDQSEVVTEVSAEGEEAVPESSVEEAAVEAPEPDDVPASPQPSQEFVALQEMLRQSNERFDKLLSMVQSQNEKPEPARDPEPDPWSRPSTDHLRVVARQRLGDVSPQLLDQYTEQVQSLARWEGAADDTPDRELNIERIKGNMRELHFRAKHQTDMATMRSEFEERLAKIEKRPGQIENASKVEATIRKQFTAPNLRKAEYPNLATAAEAGTLDIDTVLEGLDFGAISIGNPETYKALDDRLELCNRLLAGVKAKTPEPPVKKQEKAPAPDNPGIRLANPSTLAIPDQPGSTEKPALRFLEDSDYDALLKKHLTMVN